jgi:DNA polymerase
MIVGEAPGEEEERRGEVFCGASGYELNKMLEKAGLNRSQCFVTNVVRVRPAGNDITKFIPTKKKDITPDHIELRGKMVLPVVVEGYKHLMQEIDLIRPSMIIALGGTALWALTDLDGIMKWRGSMLSFDKNPSIRVLPTLHPAAILRQWEMRNVLIQDLRRAKEYVRKEWPTTKWSFTIRPSFQEVSSRLLRLIQCCNEGRQILSVDIETRAFNIACLGIAWSKDEAICIPFMELGREDGYWTEGEEAEIVFLLQRLLTHPNAQVIGQNFIYDAQYIFRSWHFIPNFCRDTMLAQHVMFPSGGDPAKMKRSEEGAAKLDLKGLPKDLAFICSLHNEQYVYWKDDGKVLSLDHDEDKHWRYNCEDCVRTFEADESLQQSIDQMNLRAPHDFQMSLFRPVLKMMNRGVAISREAQRQLSAELTAYGKEIEAWLVAVIGYKLNPKSPKQMKEFFYVEMNQPKIMKRTPNGYVLSCDSASMEKISARQPLLKGVCDRIEELRSIGVFISNFLSDKRDTDGRIRCSYNIGGTITFRFSSSENPFGSGLNLQNIPGEDKE